MPSRIDEAGHTKAFDDPVAEHWGESQRAKRSLVGLEPTSAHTYESEIQYYICLLCKQSGEGECIQGRIYEFFDGGGPGQELFKGGGVGSKSA